MPLLQPFPVATTQISLSVANSQERLIEKMSAKVLGTAASSKDKAWSGIEKHKNDSVGNDQWDHVLTYVMQDGSTQSY